MFYSASTGGFYVPEIHGENMPPDAVEIGHDRHAQLMAGQAAGLRIAPNEDGQPTLADQLPPTAEQLQAAFVAAIQQRLDEFARTRNYDGILSACTYATSTVPKFAAEGQAAVNLRDATWSTAHAILGEVQAGARPVPSSFAEIEAELPALQWPA